MVNQIYTGLLFQKIYYFLSTHEILIHMSTQSNLVIMQNASTYSSTLHNLYIHTWKPQPVGCTQLPHACPITSIQCSQSTCSYFWKQINLFNSESPNHIKEHIYLDVNSLIDRKVRSINDCTCTDVTTILVPNAQLLCSECGSLILCSQISFQTNIWLSLCTHVLWTALCGNCPDFWQWILLLSWSIVENSEHLSLKFKSNTCILFVFIPAVICYLEIIHWASKETYCITSSERHSLKSSAKSMLIIFGHRLAIIVILIIKHI